MKNNKIIGIVAAFVVALTAFVCVLVYKHVSGKDSKPETTAATTEEAADVYLPETDFNAENTTVQATIQSSSVTLPSNTETTAAEQASEPSTQPQTEATTKPVQTVSKDFSKVFTMPVAPQYVEPDVNVDFDTAKVLSYKYDPDGGYFYTDDKDCWQQNFGFNEGYDSMAPLGMMNYDTVRVKFVYDNQEWLVQMWKGQYGYAFVGGEVGLYNRKLGASGTHYNCSKQEDWLNMEMAFIWDRNHDGNYQTIFTRDYTEYWWCTGFVPGLETGAPRDQFRLVTHITFESEEMANAFCEEFEKQGFRRVSKLNNNEIDTFVQVGADVAFVWQDIVHN